MLSLQTGSATGMPRTFAPPRRILMTLDAVGGVWRYAMDLAAELAPLGTEVVFAGFGPAPRDDQKDEAKALGHLIWLSDQLDWTVACEAQLETVAGLIADAAIRFDADLVHANLPSQVAGLAVDLPVVCVTHSCVVTWFRTVRGTDLPADWRWQLRRNRIGFASADIVVAPSAAHARLTQESYGLPEAPRVVYNATRPGPVDGDRQLSALAAGRWWDDGKNGRILDAAAAQASVPVQMAGPLRSPSGQQIDLHHAVSLGEISNGALRGMMAERAIFVSPSVYEPFGLAPLEAAHAGAALVLSDIPIYRELWDGAALFAAPDDPGAFADAIDRLAFDGDLRAALAASGRIRATTFAPAAQARAMAEIYVDASRRARAPALAS